MFRRKPSTVSPSFTQLRQQYSMKTINEAAVRSLFPITWYLVSSGEDGLDLPPLSTSVELLQVNIIRQLIRQRRLSYAGLLTWFIPAQALLDEVFQGQGTGLDFLYIPLSTRAQSSRWHSMPPFWTSAIATWSTKILPRLQCVNPVFTKQTWPLWHNQFLRDSSSQRSLALLHKKACSFLRHHDVIRVSNFTSRYGELPGTASLRSALHGSAIKCSRSLTRVASVLATQLALPTHYGEFCIQPLPPDPLLAALHIWEFDGIDIVNATNKMVRRIFDTSVTSLLPLQQLVIPDEAHTQFFWVQDLRFRRDLLPVFFIFFSDSSTTDSDSGTSMAGIL